MDQVERFTDAQVRAIRESNGTLREVASEYGISVGQVSAIQRGTRRLSAGGPIRGNR